MGSGRSSQPKIYAHDISENVASDGQTEEDGLVPLAAIVIGPARRIPADVSRILEQSRRERRCHGVGSDQGEGDG